MKISKSLVEEYFNELEDPRDSRGKRHDLLEIILLAIIGSICKTDDWEEIVAICESKENWLRTFLDLKHGIPSHDTFERVFAEINPKEFANCFTAWSQALAKITDGAIVAIDGKILRSSYRDSSKKSALHLVNIWCCSNGLSLGQIAVNKKSNEITAIPELIRLLDLNKKIVTIDAMGCQKEIAKDIRKAKADYVLALKGNQGLFHKNVKSFLDKGIEEGFKRECDFFETKLEKDHGRIEKRLCYSVPLTDSDIEEKLFDNIRAWKDLKTVFVIESRKYNVKTKKNTSKRRYYITSLSLSAKELQDIVRSHWGIENNLHWVLDVVFKEDESRVRKDNAPQNLAMARKIALNLLKKDSTSKKSLKTRRVKAASSNQYLQDILFQNN